MKKVVLCMIIILVFLVGCKSEAKEAHTYLEALDKDVEKDVEKDGVMLPYFYSTFPISVPEMAKSAHLIVVGTLEEKMFDETMVKISSEEADEIILETTGKNGELYTSATTSNFIIESVISGECNEKQIRIVQDPRSMYIKPNEKVLIFLVENTCTDDIYAYTNLAFNDSVFKIENNDVLNSQSGSRLTANYDGEKLERIIKDIEYALEDESIVRNFHAKRNKKD